MAKTETTEPKTTETETETVEMISLNRFHSFENVGDTLAGRYLQYVENEEHETGDNTVPGFFLIVTDEGVTRVNETHNLEVLKRLPVGMYVEIQFIGQTKTAKGRQVNQYDIKIIKDDFLKAFAANGNQHRLISARTEARKEEDPFA